MRCALLTAAWLLASLSAFGAGLDEVKTVYLLPMSSGLDQYLAVRLTAGGTVQVMADAQKADAVLTDHLGENFEQKLDELYGARPKEAGADTAQQFARVQAGGRLRGAAFLVNRKTREVLWSAYERPKDTTPAGLKKTADKLAGELEKAFKGK